MPTQRLRPNLITRCLVIRFGRNRQQRYAHHFHPTLGDAKRWLTQPLSQFSTLLSVGDACLIPPSLGDAGLFPPSLGDAYVLPRQPLVAPRVIRACRYYGKSVSSSSYYIAMASPHVSNTPMNQCPPGLHDSFLSVPQLTPNTVSCQSHWLSTCLCSQESIVIVSSRG